MIGIGYRERISETDLEKIIYWSREVVALLDFFCFVEIIYSVNTLLNKRSVEYMSEVMISRRGGGSGGGSGELVYKSLTFTTNQNWTVPNGIINNEVIVRIVGAGGSGWFYPGGSNSGFNVIGGGGRWMNNDILKLASGEIINMKIGAKPSVNAASGGTTSFGGYLSAFGGSGCSWESRVAGSGGSGGGACAGNGGWGWQFGGGGGWWGSRGGPWGGGAGGGHGGCRKARKCGSYPAFCRCCQRGCCHRLRPAMRPLQS